MYVGRFVVVAPGIAAYRVSSRSFPDRHVYERDGTLVVGPTDDAPETDNPYVSYTCLRLVDGGEEPDADGAGGGHAQDGAGGQRRVAVVGNGSHVDPIAEKLALGYPARDALVTALHALDYEKDDYDTPRIAGTLGADGAAYVGTVRRDALRVERVAEPTLVATYERDAPAPFGLAAGTADEAAREVYDLDFEHPVCAAAVATGDDGFQTAFVNE